MPSIGHAFPLFTHAAIAVRLLREAAAFYRQEGEQDVTLAARMRVNADIAEQAAAMIETDPTGGCDRLPQPSFEDEQPFYTPIKDIRLG